MPVEPIGQSALPEDRLVLQAVGARNLNKVTPPTLVRVHPNRRLFHRLDEAASRIVWIQGPPGAGKTTLVASYLADKGIEPLWYRLDDADTDPATLFLYLGAAWRGRDTGLSLPLLTPDHKLALPTFARRFFRSLFQCSKTSVVVFDDHHAVPANASLHQCLASGFEEVPVGCQVIVVSRQPPPPELARLRLNGMIEVIAPDELCLTLKEAEGLARERGGAAQSSIETIHRQTQGWAAGLILMLDAGPQTSSRSDALGTSELLFDYFAGEIFKRMSPDHRRLLCISALMPTNTTVSVERLTGSKEAGDLLETLRKLNYFTSRDAASEPNYRFHPLFRDFLLESGSKLLSRDDLVTLRVAAAVLLEQSGQADAAFCLLDSVRAQASMADLVRRNAEQLIDEGRNDTLLAWLARLPKDLIDADAWLNHWSGLVVVYDNPVEAIFFFRRAFALFKAADDIAGQFMAWAGQAEVLRIDAFGSMTRYDGLIDTMRELLSRYPDIEDPKVMSEVAMGMATGLSRRTNRRDEIEVWQQRARVATKRTGNRGRALLHGYMFAITDVHDANYDGMRQTLDALPDPRTLDHLPHVQASGLIAHVLSRLYRVKDGDCAALVENAIARMEGHGYFYWTPLLAGCAANAACRRGDTMDCAAWLDRMAIAADRVSPNRGVHYHLSVAQYLILKSDPVGAKMNAEKAIELTSPTGWLMFEAFSRLAAAEASVEMRSFDEADQELARLDDVLARSTTRVLAAPAILLRADLEDGRGNGNRADTLLRAGIALASQHGDRRLSLSFQRLGRLFGRALRLGIEPDYVRDYIRDLGFSAPDPYDPRWPWPLKIMTFGGLVIELDGKPLRFARKTPKRLVMLLKAILAYGGRDIPEERLIDAIWADEDGDCAHNSLRVAIHRLRKLLGDRGQIIWKNGRVGLDPSRCWVDFWTFDYLAMRRAPPEERGDIDSLFALDFDGGDFLAGDEDLWWTARSREILQALQALFAGLFVGFGVTLARRE